jgi:hypothetical protein
MNSILHRAPAETTPTRLALRHSRQLVFCSMACNPSTSLRSLRSIPITELHRYYGRSDSCSGGSSVPYWQHEHRLCPKQGSLLHAPELPIPPSPTTDHPSDIAFARYPSACRTSRSLGSGLHLSLAGSSFMTGRIEFVILRMDRSPPAAPHPVSQRRSCSRLQAGERIPEGDLHPSVQYLQHFVRLQAHECASLLAPFMDARFFPINCDQSRLKSGSQLPHSKAPSARDAKTLQH